MADVETHASIEIDLTGDADGWLQLELEEDENATPLEEVDPGLTIGSSYLASFTGSSPRELSDGTFQFGSGKLEFKPAVAPCYLAYRGDGSGNGRFARLMPAGSGATIYTNLGEAKFVGMNVSRTITKEKIIFVNVTEGSLQYLPDPTQEVIYEWVGQHHGGGEPVFDGKTVKLEDVCFCGVLLVTYITLFDRIEITYAGIGSLLLTAVKGELEAYLEIDFGGGDGSATTSSTDPGATSTTLPGGGGLKNVLWTVKDYCTDEILGGVTVIIGGPTGVHTGVTNENGQVLFGNLQVGGTYSVKMTAATYLDSDQDALNNDSVTIV